MDVLSFRCTASAVVLCALFTATAPRAAVVVLHARSGWQVQSAEKILINGKLKIRLASAGDSQLSGESYKKLTQELIAASPIRVTARGWFARRVGNGWAPVAPDGAQVKGSIELASLWSSATFEVQQEKSSKRSQLRGSEVFAVLPGEDSGGAVVDFLNDPLNFTGVGERDAAASFDERMSLLVGIATSLNDADSRRLRGMLLEQMVPVLEQSETGLLKYSDLERALRFADVSDRAFPGDPRQKQVRGGLRAQKASIDARVAILKALGAGEQWDAVIEKYGDFERFDASFDDVRKLRDRSFHESARMHFDEGQQFYKREQFTPALVEMKLAHLRSPEDRHIAEQLEIARLQEAKWNSSRIVAKPVDIRSPEQRQFDKSISGAESDIDDKRYDAADEELSNAEALNKDSPRVLLTRARLLQGRGHLQEAINTLDQYDRLVNTDAEVKAGFDLRDKIDHVLTVARESATTRLHQAELDGDYAEALKAANDGFNLDSTDPLFLYHAGTNSAIMRQVDDAQKRFKAYLTASQARNEEHELRARVFSILPLLRGSRQPPQGAPNWFSGYPSRNGLLYCPVSIVPNVKPLQIRGSRKLMVEYSWKAGLLEAVHTTNAPGEHGFDLYFDYFPDQKSVRRIATEPFKPEKEQPPPPRLTPAGTVGSGPGTYFALFNHPVLDPHMVEALTGKRVATVVAGNPWFHPFVWNDIHTFLAAYDSSGHLTSATEITAGAPHRTLDFSWDSDRLMAISERPGADSELYRREMSYSGDRITGETIHFGARTSRIEYKYQGDQLVEANCESDPSLDGRSRRVTFRQ